MSSAIQPPSILLAGAPGAGKTDVLTTFVEAGIETFVLITEPGGVESLLDSMERRRLDMSKLHWMEAIPAMVDVPTMEKLFSIVGSTSYEDIAKIKVGIEKDKTKLPAMGMLHALKDFKCARTGQSYGSVFSWDDSRAFCFDSLSGMSMMALHLTVGFKPSLHQGEWGVAMNTVETLVNQITGTRRCFFTLTSHVEKEASELTGVQQIMASTLGRKLAPKLPRFFSEFVYATRSKTGGFNWSTIDNMMDLKNRSLPLSDKITPSFVPIVEAHRRRKKLIEGHAAPPKSA